ncbi:hypothetical protein QEN19_002000 [Hanseniaspora menglaensis]
MLDFFKKHDYPKINETSSLPELSKGLFLPVWGNVTSTIDWCEENYVQSSFIAEFCNTISNMTYILVAGILYHRLTYKLNILEKRFKLTMIGLLLVGLGSAMFHMSLRYDCQLLDELPMIYITCIPCYSVLCEPLLYKKNKEGADEEETSILIQNENKFIAVSKKLEYFVALSLTVISLIMTFSYIYYITNPIFHEVCYAILNAIIVYCASYLTRKHINDIEVKTNLIKSSLRGVSLFALGFVLWGLDRQYCKSLIYVRREYLKLPLGNILELHAYWHIFTGLGLYYMLNFLIFLRINLHNKIKGDVYYETNGGYKMDWIFFRQVPVMRKTPQTCR